MWCDNLIVWPVEWVFEGGLLYGIIPLFIELVCEKCVLVHSP